MLNEMMYRPVVKPEIVNLMRTKQKYLPGELGKLEETAHEKGIPIIPHETVVFLQFLLKQIQPTSVLEIGTAIGFSAALMAQTMGKAGKVTTIDRFDVMIERAKENFQQLGVADQIELLEGQAADLLPTLSGPYDFILMDCSKSKYLDFLPECLRLMSMNSVLFVDDIFQGGTILDPIDSIKRRNRGIHKKLNQFLDLVLQHPDLTTSLLPLGDGVLLLSKNVEQVDLSAANLRK